MVNVVYCCNVFSNYEDTVDELTACRTDTLTSTVACVFSVCG